MHATRVNAAEALIERFWDPLRSGLAHWRFQADPATGGHLSQNWCSVNIDWQRGDGRWVGRLTRQVDLALGDYDHLTLSAALPATARLTIRAVVDGEELVVVRDAAGVNDFCEYEGALRGSKLQRLRIELTDTGGDPSQAVLQWLLLANLQRRTEMRARTGLDPAALDDLLLPADANVARAPTLGLFFDDGDLDTLRHKAAQPGYAPLIDGLRRLARAYLTSEPWRGVDTYLNGGISRYGRAHAGEQIDPLAMRLCAFIGLLDDDPALMRMALQQALCAAHCEHWVEGFMSTAPGTTWDHRAFIPYRIATNLVYAWDWAGAYLTEAGREVLAQAVGIKGLPWMAFSLMRHPYMRGCNQGAYMSYGAIICELALSQVWGCAGETLPVWQAAMDETVNTYIGKDGGAFEGMGYYTATIGHAVVAYAALARAQMHPLAEVIPERLRLAPNFIATMLSTAPPLGSSINVSDGGRPGTALYPDCLGLLHALLPQAGLDGLLAGVLPSTGMPLRENYATPGSIFAFLYGPTHLPPAEARPPVFSVLPYTGQLCSCRPTPQGPVRVQLIGAPANAGHTHQDRGSFVIEAFGEEIAIDRGQMSYEDPRCNVIQQARYHNVLIPDEADGTLPEQLSPCPEAVLPEGQGDAHVLQGRVDAGAAWGERVQAWVRSIDSGVPQRLLITDDVTLPAAGTVSFHLHSRFPWVRTPHGWQTAGLRALLTVRPRWEPVAATGEEDFVDGRREPAYHLTLRAPAAITHHLETELHLAPVEDA